MAGKVTNSAPFREQMPNAASASLSGSLLTAFNAHLRDCAACRDEFCRVQTLLQAIDHTMSVSLATEPSAQLVANVRKNIQENIAAEAHRAEAWGRWSAWATAAGICAATAILLFVAHIPRKSNPPLHSSATVQTNASSTSRPLSHPTLSPSVDPSATEPSKPASTRILHASRTARSNAAEPDITKPEIIVQPGQMQAILRFAAAMQRGQIDGAQFLAGQKTITEPIEIKPLPVASPLKIEPLDADSAPADSARGEALEKNPIPGHSD